MNIYETIAEVTTPTTTSQKEESVEKLPLFAKEYFFSKLRAWGYSLAISLLPFFIAFMFTNRTQKNVVLLDFFYDNSLLYLCVTLSAISIYVYGRESKMTSIHIFIAIAGMGIFCTSTIVDSIPSYTPLFFDIVDRRIFIACFLTLSIFAGLCTLIISSIRKGERK